MISAFALTCALGRPTTVVAQSATAGDQSHESNTPGLETIVVTAQRRNESIQNIPLSITALSGTELEASGINTTQELQLVTPGLFWGRSSAYSQPTIRGVGSRNGGVGDEPNVATYVDDVYYPDQLATIFSLANLERVEVLKGPQGTLYGRNATGGVIRLITKKPTFTPEGSMLLEAGGFDYKKLTAYASGPFVDNALAGSVSLFTSSDNGYVKNIFLDKTTGKSDEFSVRGKLLYTPTEQTELQLNGTYSDSDNNVGQVGQPSNGGNTVARVIPNPTEIPLDVIIPSEPYRTSTHVANPYNKVRLSEGDLQAKSKFDSFTLKVLISGMDMKQQNYSDVQYMPFSVFDVRYTQNSKSYNEEVILSSVDDGALQWMAGAAAFQLDYDATFNYIINGGADGGGINSYFRSEQSTRSYSAFAEVTYSFADKVFLTGGARFNHDSREGSYQRTTADGTPIGAASKGQRDWDNFSPKAGIRYQFTPDSNVYFTYTRGFKSGVFAVTSNPIGEPAKPEEITAYEVGIKSDITHTVRMTAAAFHYDYTNLQTTVLEPLPGGGLVTLFQNAPAAESDGVEFTIQAEPTDGLSLHAGVSWLNARVTDFRNAAVTVPRIVNGLPSGNLQVPADVTGNDLIRAPDWTVNLGVDYTTPLYGGELALHASAYFSANWYTDLLNRVGQPDYEVVNAAVSWTAPNNISFAVFGENLTDQAYANAFYTSTLGDNVTFAKPRWFGGRISYSF